MKNNIELNIGLARNDGQGENTLESIAAALRYHGFILTAARLVIGEWEGKPEETLTCQVLPALPLCHVSCRHAISATVAKLARSLGQTCIALRWPEGTGELSPAVAEFNPEKFFRVFPDLSRQAGAPSVPEY